jgi:hypothetical protein
VVDGESTVMNGEFQHDFFYVATEVPGRSFPADAAKALWWRGIMPNYT